MGKAFQLCYVLFILVIQNNMSLASERVVNQTSRSNVTETPSPFPDYDDDYDDDGDDRDNNDRDNGEGGQGEYSTFHNKFPVGMWKPGSSKFFLFFIEDNITFIFFFYLCFISSFT